MAVIQGRYCAFYLTTTAASQATTGLAMARFGSTMWWKCSDYMKGMWDRAKSIVVYDGVTPITPLEFAYAGGWVRLASVPSGTVTADVSYFALAQVLGGKGWSIDPEMQTEESTVFGSLAKENEPIMLNWKGSLDAFWWPIHANLTTELGDNKDLSITAREGGPNGDAISYEVAVAENNTPLSVSVTGSAIVVNSATGSGGAATSTAMQILTALCLDEQAMRLVKVRLAAGSSGVGVPGAISHVHLSGGTSPTTLAALVAGQEVMAVFKTDDTVNNCRYEGIAILDKVSIQQQVAKLITSPLNYTGSGMLYYHEG